MTPSPFPLPREDLVMPGAGVPLAQEVPYATAAPEVRLDDQAVCRVGHGIEVQIVDTRALVWVLRALVCKYLPILEIGLIHALVEVAVPRTGGLRAQQRQQLGQQHVKVLL